jgi:hypothetical protein
MQRTRDRSVPRTDDRPGFSGRIHFASAGRKARFRTREHDRAEIRCEYTGLRAVLLEDGTLKAEIAVTAYRRREKMIFSLIPAVLIVLLFGARFRFNFRSLIFERRNRA